MPSIRDYAFTEGTLAAALWSADMPVHQSGDLLVAFCNQDTATTINLPGGWTDAAGGNRAGTGHTMRVFYTYATSSAAALNVTTAASDTFTITVVAIQDVTGSSPINAVSERTADDASVPFAGSAVTTTTSSCLVLSFLSTDGGLGPTCEPGWINLVTGDAGANSGGLAYTYQRVSGTVAAPNWYGQLADNTMSTTLAIHDDGSETTVPPYVSRVVSPGRMLDLCYWITGGGSNAWGNSWPTSLSLAAIGSKTAAFDAGALTADTGINPYHGSLSCTPAASSNGSTVSGPQMNFASAVNMTGSILLTSYQFATPRDYVDLSTSTDAGQCGMLFVTYDGAAYKAWSVGTKGDKTTKSDGRVLAAIQVDQSTDTRFATGGSQDDAAVDGTLFLAQGKYGAVACRRSCVFLAEELQIVGGSSTVPLDFDDVEFVLNNSIGNFPLMVREGSAATFLTPIRIGGTDPVHIAVNLRTLQYRRQSDGIDYFDWHVDDNRCGFEFDGQTGDTISFTNCVFSNGSSAYWRFSSDFSSGCTHSFAGSVVINAVVTLRSTVTLDGVTFIDCSTFTQNNAALDSCAFSNTLVTSDNPADISDCEFTSDGTGHGIEITTPGTYTFNANTFSGFGADATTDAAVYNNSGGAVTLNITGGGDSPTVRNGAGASTTVNNQVTLTLTNIVSGSEVRVMTAGTADELDGTEQSGPTFAYAYDYSPAQFIDVVVLHMSYRYLKVSNIELAASDNSIPVQQEIDRVYSNP